jgi:hypothetical protein
MSWSEFITHLAALDLPSAPPIWRMSDGQSIRQAIPDLDPGADCDEQIIDFGKATIGHKLYEVVEMEIEPETPADREAQLDAIEQAARVSGLIYRRKPDRIIIRAPYTC